MSGLQLPRRMIFLPDLAPHFVLAIQDVFGWSIRDYSSGRAELRFARDIGSPIEDLIEAARVGKGLVFDAPSVSLSNQAFWKRLTDELGMRLLARPEREAELHPTLAEGELLRLAASVSPSDAQRLLAGPSSADWITWNAMHLLTKEWTDGSWWSRIADRVAAENALHIPFPLQPVPRTLFWHTAEPSDRYEPAEEPARIDLTFDSPACLIYVESKIKQDIALGMPGDERRNRLVRLADCLLTEARERTCALWVFARDTDDRRQYVQLVNLYRESPEMFAAELPHHPAEPLYALARRLTVVRWSDVLGPALQRRSEDDHVIASVRSALRRRLQGSAAAAATAADGK